MNKEGFTLVELLAILVVLGIIILVALPALVESNRVAKTNEIEDFKETVETACNAYVTVEKPASSVSSISIENLKTGGYLKSNIQPPKEGMPSDVNITLNGCNYNYSG